MGDPGHPCSQSDRAGSFHNSLSTLDDSALIQERDGGDLRILGRLLYSFPQHELDPRVRLGGFVWMGWMMSGG